MLAPTGLTKNDIGGIFASRSSVRTPMWKDATMEKISRMSNGNGKPRKSTLWSIKRMAAILLVLTWPRRFMALVLTTLRRNMQLKNLRHYMHVDGRQKTVLYRIKRQALPDVRDAPLDDDNAAASSTNAKPRWRRIPYASSWSSTHESFGRFTLFSALVSPSNDTCRWSFVLVFFVCLFVCLLLLLLCVLLVSCFASVIGFSQILRAY